MTGTNRILAILAAVLLGICPAVAKTSTHIQPRAAPAGLFCQPLNRALKVLASKYHELPIWESRAAGIAGVGEIILTESVGTAKHPGTWTLLFLAESGGPASTAKACLLASGDTGIVL